MSGTLRKIATRVVRQDTRSFRKDWYHARDADLVVRCRRRWHGGRGEIVSFELTFERGRDAGMSQVLWEQGRPLATGAVDDGEVTGDLLKKSPVVSPHVQADPAVLRDAADLVADPRHRLDENVRAFILSRLREAAG